MHFIYETEIDNIKQRLDQNWETLREMKKLKPELRIVMALHYVDGYSIQEMAEALGIL